MGEADVLQVCRSRCKITISGSALSGGRLPRSLQNGSFLVTGFHAFLFSFTVLRAASMRDIFVEHHVRCKSAVSLHLTHGLIPHKAARLTSRATRESFESLAPAENRGCFIWPPERSTERVSAEMLLAGSSPRAVFYTPVAQVAEQRPPKPPVAGSSPAGSACVI